MRRCWPNPAAPIFLRLTQHDGSIGNEDVLVIVGIDGIRDKHLDRANGIPIKPVHQHGVHRQPS